MSTAEERFSTGTAVVTGGAAGIGEGFVRHLARLGMTVVIADIDADGARAVAGDIVVAGGSAEPYGVDVTDPDAVEAMARHVFDRFGSVELFVNNAGVENAGLLWEVSVERWRKVLDINVDGVFYCLRSFVPRMIEAGTAACIANLSSVGGLNSVAVQAPYIVSKHAVLALTECLHQELSLVGAPIQVSAVLPHSIRSHIFLAAQRDAPTENPTANAVFTAMQRANVEAGLDPVDAAVHMTEAIARGDFWVFSNDEVCTSMAATRARQLLELTPPADPRLMLDRMGVTAPARDVLSHS
ncbi:MULTISPECIES: SDR family NAD(P)-dependent oxidoreductase [unclassified Rhodococcus (in: high G+C Gram-positive bacteria)]|uniref:SDR family NAD(P)-dependent oxidoreductase n=1 Tax=unclassified Rhodococcus (in: high G+C Gram-positive bacteria) TaxID=192944 RepID=UPI00092BC41C|nr:SDR family NAD(P)-dependent oxidoreductase [Rhodococcus sp. M8]OLL21293.1 short-chain dehydrogenase [Rhodococcus sp. M8]QPG47387.1 SDR family NAD(P)-dependent oxidoreductase [Rhodococcus sp. M8]